MRERREVLNPPLSGALSTRVILSTGGRERHLQGLGTRDPLTYLAVPAGVPGGGLDWRASSSLSRKTVKERHTSDVTTVLLVQCYPT